MATYKFNIHLKSSLTLKNVFKQRFNDEEDLQNFIVSMIGTGNDDHVEVVVGNYKGKKIFLNTSNIEAIVTNKIDDKTFFEEKPSKKNKKK